MVIILLIGTITVMASLDHTMYQFKGGDIVYKLILCSPPTRRLIEKNIKIFSFDRGNSATIFNIFIENLINYYNVQKSNNFIV